MNFVNPRDLSRATAHSDSVAADLYVIEQLRDEFRTGLLTLLSIAREKSMLLRNVSADTLLHDLRVFHPDNEAKDLFSDGFADTETSLENMLVEGEG